MLYPPQIGGIIPSFEKKNGTNTKILVPYTMNRSVSYGEVFGFILKIKDIISNEVLFTAETKDIDYNNSIAVFTLEAEKNAKLHVGQFYKIQMAYIDNNNQIGYYSSIGTIKCTSELILSIQNLDKNTINRHRYNYIGVCENTEDTTEKVDNYQFLLLDDMNKIIYDSGKRIHNNNENNVNNRSEDACYIDFDLDKNKTYTLKYSVTTQNQLSKTCSYQIFQGKLNNIDSSDIQYITLNTKVNCDNGYIQLHLFSKEPVCGNFIISKTSATSNYKKWETVNKICVKNKQCINIYKKDMNIIQGVTYRYAVQQINDFDFLTAKKYAEQDLIKADFEDMFLSDSKLCLKIRYNPKVSSFKTSLLETKVDTMGSKYPFFTRNDIVSYKDFPIAGLISYLMDEENLFISKEELCLEDDLLDRKHTPAKVKESFGDNFSSTNLTSQNFYAERIFKHKVLDWLNNGKPKLFKSPSEGNYIVRLMNVNLTPEEKLGRMIHSFNANAYEIDELNYENLIKNDLISVDSLLFKQSLYKTIRLSQSGTITELYDEFWQKIDNTGHLVYANGELLEDTEVAHYIYCENLKPGSVITIDGKQIVIGPTGKYRVKSKNGFNSIKIDETSRYEGAITIGYYGNINKYNRQIINESIKRVAVDQIPGPQDVIETKNNIKDQIQNFHYLEFKNKDIVSIKNNVKIVEKYRDALTGEKIYEYKPYTFYTLNDEKQMQTDISENISFNKKYYLDQQGTHQVSIMQNGIGYNPLGAKLVIFEQNKYYSLKNGVYVLSDDFEIDFNKKYYEKIADNDFIPVSFMTQYHEESFIDNFDRGNFNILYYFQTNKICLNDKVLDLKESVNVLRDFYNDKYYIQNIEDFKNNIEIVDDITDNKINSYIEEYSTKSYYNNTEIDSDKKIFIDKNLDNIETLYVANGSILTCGYDLKTITYMGEQNHVLKALYKEICDIEKKLMINNNYDVSDINNLITQYQEQLASQIIAYNYISAEQNETYNSLVKQYNELMEIYEKIQNNVSVDLNDYDWLSSFKQTVFIDSNIIVNEYKYKYKLYLENLFKLLETEERV